MSVLRVKFVLTILMIKMNKYLFLLISLVLVSPFLSAQMGALDSDILPEYNVPKYRVPINRQTLHETIDREQKNILAADGKADKIYSATANEEINFLLTKALTYKIDVLQYQIEKDSTLDHRLKVNYLTGISNLLKYIKSNWKNKTVNPLHLPETIDAYQKCIKIDKESKSIANTISSLPYDAGYAVLKAEIFGKNAGYKSSRDLLILKYCNLYPAQTFLILKDNPDFLFADSLVRTIAKKYPGQLYNYAQANNRLGAIIRNIKDDVFISTVARMARSKSGQQYFPFLDNIVNGKMTIEEIDAVEKDPVQYYRLLVKTQMNYTERLLNKDTAFAFKELEKRIETKATDIFVNTINALHDVDNPAVRFKIIQPLNAEELYYLAVSTDGIIFTSSFVKGVYPLMMSRANRRGDSLLMNVRFDKYRKFIKMAAGYNTLSDFLASFPDKKDAEKLMQAFVGKLEQSAGLEDGVDVADSYGSIAETIKPLADQMLLNIKANYERNLSSNNQRGIVMYNLLNKLFLSADTNNHINLSREFGIPPVYEVPYKALTDEDGRIIIQVFMYGDKDGIGIFPGILNMFNNSFWKTDQNNPQWVTVTSAKGKPITIFLNRPLPEETNKDAEAQKSLCEYLEKKQLYPTVTINRGHSYNAPYTIEQMFPSSKIVFMGSCGGFRMIHDILQKAPDAHIIGTKQVADAPVNNPFLKLITEKLRNGEDIEWIPFWKELEKMANNKIFDDYVPPHKNLGAIFIKAYKKEMGGEE
jgi:hypothetical protein